MASDALAEALASSQRLGMLGARPIDEVVDHARAFVAALVGVRGRVIDLGTGGGVPGLVIAVERPDLQLVLVDRRTTRTDHVRRLVRRLGLGARVEVVTGDVERIALPPAAAVVARGFGPPVTTMRAAAPLLAPGGRLIVSEPPADHQASARWPTADVTAAGFTATAWPDRRVAVLRRP